MRERESRAKVSNHISLNVIFRKSCWKSCLHYCSTSAPLTPKMIFHSSFSLSLSESFSFSVNLRVDWSWKIAGAMCTLSCSLVRHFLAHFIHMLHTHSPCQLLLRLIVNIEWAREVRAQSLISRGALCGADTIYIKLPMLNVSPGNGFSIQLF